jgi:hypothetical protein
MENWFDFEFSKQHVHTQLHIKMHSYQLFEKAVQQKKGLQEPETIWGSAHMHHIWKVLISLGGGGALNLLNTHVWGVSKKAEHQKNIH